MRKTLLLLMCLFYLFNAKAAHEQAIEMFYDYNQQSGTYDFSLVVYVPTTGSYPPSVVLSSNHPTINTLNLPVDSTFIITYTCNTQIRVIIYKVKGIQIGAVPASAYTFTYAHCCRSFAINNLSPPGGSIRYMEMVMWPIPGATHSSSSPRFNFGQGIVASAGWSGTINSTAYDPDPQDSIYAELVTARTTNGAPVQYSPLFSATSPFGNQANLNVDPATGLITYTQANLGMFVVVIRVQSFRNGQLVSRIIREGQYVLTPPVPSVFYFDVTNQGNSANNFTQTNQTYTAEMNAGDTLDLLLSAFSNTTTNGNVVVMNISGSSNNITPNASGINCNGAQCATLIGVGNGLVAPQFSQGRFYYRPTAATVPPNANHAFINFALEAWFVDSCNIRRSKTVSLVVKVNKPKSIYGPTLIKYCAGQQYSYQLFGDSANVSWFPSTGLSQANIPNPIIQTNTSTNYLVVNNNNGDTLHVQVIVGQTNPAQWSLAPLSASILNYTDYDTVKWYYYNEVFKRDTIAVYTYPSGVYSATYQNYPCLKYTDTVTNLPTTDLTFTDFTGRRFSTPDLGGFFEIKFSSPLQGRRLSNLYMLFPDAENALSPFNPIVTLRDSSGAIVLQDTIVIQLYGFFILQNMALPMVENMVYTLQIQVPKNVYKVLQPLQYPYIPNGGNVAITTAKFTNANNTFSFAVQPYLSISTTARIGNEEFAAKEKITVFPNPFSQEIITDLVGNYTFELLDATGKQIMFGQYTDAQAIDTGHLPRGFYTYRIVTTTGLHSGKLVK